MKKFFVLFFATACVLSAAGRRWVPKSSAVGGAGISIVNNWQNKTGGATSVSVTVSPAAGHALVVAYVTSDATPVISDNLSSTYTTVPANTGFGNLVGFSFLPSAGSGLTTVTVTPSASAVIQVYVYEVANVSTYTTGERATGFDVSSATTTSGSLTTATANSIIFFLGAAPTGNGATTFGSYSAGYALFTTGAASTYASGDSDFASAVPYKVVSSAGSQSCAMTATVSANWINLIVAFH